jgi:hypothetical protein
MGGLLVFIEWAGRAGNGLEFIARNVFATDRDAFKHLRVAGGGMPAYLERQTE